MLATGEFDCSAMMVCLDCIRLLEIPPITTNTNAAKVVLVNRIIFFHWILSHFETCYSITVKKNYEIEMRRDR